MKTVANFGLYLKDFIHVKGLLQKIVNIIMEGVDSQQGKQKKTNFSREEIEIKMIAIFALKNLGLDCKDGIKQSYQAVVSHDFLYKVLNEPSLIILREQILLILQQNFSRATFKPETNKTFLKSKEETTQFFTAMTQVFKTSFEA